LDMQRIVERVKKMLALASDKGASEGERDNALRMVHAYLAKYNLDMETVAGAKSATERKKEEADGGPRSHHVHSFFGRPWACNAAISVAKLCFCGYLYRAGRISKDSQHVFIGRTANAVTAAYLAEFVVNSIHAEGRKRQRQQALSNPWFLSFAWGASLVIQERVDELMRANPQIAPSSGTDIVLADLYTREAAANREYQEVAFPHLKRGVRGKGIRDHEAFRDGIAYGSTINLNRQVR